MALHLLHGSPAVAIAFYDPKLGAVVVSSHSKKWSTVEVIDITLPAPESISEKTQPLEERDR
jgi:CRISPR-associated protein Csx3